jgi:hypothetical protein
MAFKRHHFKQECLKWCALLGPAPTSASSLSCILTNGMTASDWGIP